MSLGKYMSLELWHHFGVSMLNLVGGRHFSMFQWKRTHSWICLVIVYFLLQYHLGNMCKRYLLFQPPITKSRIVPYIIDNVFYIAPKKRRGIKLPDVARCCERLSNWFIAPPLEWSLWFIKHRLVTSLVRILASFFVEIIIHLGNLQTNQHVNWRLPFLSNLFNSASMPFFSWFWWLWKWKTSGPWKMS